jgi:hypothetical protein
MNTDSMTSAPFITSSAVMSFALRCPIGRQSRRRPLCQHGAQTLLVSAPIGCRHGVAVPTRRPVGVERPGDGPFDPALSVASLAGGEILTPCERFGRDALAPADLLREVVGQTAWKADVASAGTSALASFRRTAPADSTLQQVGFRTGSLNRRLGVNCLSPNICGSGVKVTVVPRRLGAAPTFAAGQASGAAELLRVQLLVARNLDPCVFRQRIDDADADAVQAAAGRIALPENLPPECRVRGSPPAKTCPEILDAHRPECRGHCR